MAPHLDLPIHPTMRHPLTGQPLRAIYVDRRGRARWPLMGGAPTDDGGDGGQGGDGGDGGQNGNGSGAGGDGRANATDPQGNDLGYPKDTRVAEMTAEEQAAYWKHQSQKHEGRYKSLVGDRSFDDVRKDLTDYADLQRQQQTPAEQALAEAREEGAKAATAAERNKAATAIFRGALEANGLEGDDLEELVANFNVAGYISDDGVDTTKITNFAKRFSSTPDTGGQQQRRRDFGGGRRNGGNGSSKSGATAELERRYGKQTKSGE